MTKVKICGLNDSAALQAAVEAGADWVGFVFFPPSPRSVTPARAAALSALAEGGPPRVGLFVDPSEADIARVLEVVKLDVLQVYGTAVDVPRLRSRFGLPVWRPVGVSRAADLPDMALEADALLIEAKPPEGATRPGGNATTFDWTLLRGWTAPMPWLLAGGLTPDNVATAIAHTGATAVDVSSGVEQSKGLKDPALIRAFIARAKGAGRTDQATSPPFVP
jgi:phosphoribosylanthranilate isomerase